MNDTLCSYQGNRDELLVAYLYDDIDMAERAAFEAHKVRCAACRNELAALRAVRVRLGQWAPPEPAGAAAASAKRAWWLEVPAWARVAAALLFLAVAAGVANLDVKYNREGLSVRTGWSPPAATTTGTATPPSPSSAPWRADLAALERQLRVEFHAANVGGATTRATPRATMTTRPRAGDAEVVGRVRALIEESERIQRRELALRVSEVVRDVQVQRQADLANIDRSLGLIQNDTGVEVMRQRELLNYLVRVSQKQ
jgi:hypothetical protein